MLLVEGGDFGQLLAGWTLGVFDAVADGDDGADGLVVGNGEQMPELVGMADADDEGVDVEFSCLEQEIGVLESEVIPSPSVACLVVGLSVGVADDVVLEGSYDDGAHAFRLLWVAASEAGACGGKGVGPCDDVIARCLLVLPRRRFLCKADEREEFILGHRLPVVAADAASMQRDVIECHGRGALMYRFLVFQFQGSTSSHCITEPLRRAGSGPAKSML